MGLFDIFKKENKENKKAIFISNAGGMIITKSLLEGKSKLKWIFRENSTNAADNGWRAIGDTDTQEYINNSKNMTVVDFNKHTSRICRFVNDVLQKSKNFAEG